ncbi:MAG: hypothetical protein ACUVS7_17995 [Bryobacteraceae bacterium]
MLPGIPVGSTAGVPGRGQLRRMFAIMECRMVCHAHALAPDENAPTGQVADAGIRTACDDPAAAVRPFAVHADAMTNRAESFRAPASGTNCAGQSGPSVRGTLSGPYAEPI